jgi:large subunit ribosomal protein L32
MPVPKKKMSKSKKRHRRGHDKLPNPTLVPCEQCKKHVLAHHVCEYCGYYRGRKILEITAK